MTTQTHSGSEVRLLNRVGALVERGERISVEDIAALFAVSDVTALARIARVPRERRWGSTAFHVDARDPAGHAIDADPPRAGVGAILRARDADEMARCIDMLAQLSRAGATPVIHASVDAFDALSHGDLHSAMLEASRRVRLVITGEGAELFDPTQRNRIAPGAVSPERWLAVHRAAHAAGVSSVASMTYLTDDAPHAYAAHLEAIRVLQDETGGFGHFVPVPFHDAGQGASFRAAPTAVKALRAVAVSRIALDNVPHVSVAPALTGLEIGIVALSHGADTCDSTIAASMVASHRRLTALTVLGGPVVDDGVMASRIAEARFLPVPVDAGYEIIDTDRPQSGRPDIVHHS